MINVVLDTSVVIAAARSQRGASSLLIGWLNEGRYGAAVSANLILEYEAVLHRHITTTGWSNADISNFINFMCFRCLLAHPTYRLRPALGDSNDDFMLELAVAAHEDFLVTHNVRDFAGSEAFGVKVI